jgi:hypothetical protein
MSLQRQYVGRPRAEVHRPGFPGVAGLKRDNPKARAPLAQVGYLQDLAVSPVE